jgi:1,2-diacylglycerol 3-alpha-glucosyltransferase
MRSVSVVKQGSLRTPSRAAVDRGKRKSSRRPVIGLVSDSYFPVIDGVFKAVHHLACALGAHADVVVVVPRPRDRESIARFYADLPYRVIFCATHRVSLQGYTPAAPRLDAGFQREFADAGFDIIHTNGVYPLSCYAVDFARSHGIPVVTTIHSQFTPDLQRYVKVGWAVRAVVRGFVHTVNRHDLAFTLNPGMDALAREQGVTVPTVVRPNGTHVGDMTKTAARAAPGSLLFVGRLVSMKGIFLIVDALALLAQRGVDFHMCFVGRGVDERRLRRRIARHRLAERVVLSGCVTDEAELADFYRSSSLLLLPSRPEADPLVVKEAAVYRVPSLVLEGSIMAAGIVNGVNGFTAPSDPRGFADALAAVLSDEPRRRKAGEAARRDLAVSWEEVARDFVRVYHGLLIRKGAVTVGDALLGADLRRPRRAGRSVPPSSPVLSRSTAPLRALTK